jgi:REP element-mobilizing transposase RayT
MSSKFRKSLRLPNFDYSQDGAYFITIVTQNRACLFGEIIDEQMLLNDAGRMIEQVCQELPMNLPYVGLEILQIMPNHFHGIFTIENVESVGAGLRACPQPQISLTDIVGRFKSLTTHRYIEGVKMNEWQSFDRRLWQRNYYEHIIRNETEHQAIADYIFCNPQNWKKDSEYPH